MSIREVWTLACNGNKQWTRECWSTIWERHTQPELACSHYFLSNSSRNSCFATSVGSGPCFSAAATGSPRKAACSEFESSKMLVLGFFRTPNEWKHRWTHEIRIFGPEVHWNTIDHTKLCFFELWNTLNTPLNTRNYDFSKLNATKCTRKRGDLVGILLFGRAVQSQKRANCNLFISVIIGRALKRLQTRTIKTTDTGLGIRFTGSNFCSK